MTWVVKSGGGRFSFEVQLSVTDNISDATSGSFVALYTSTSDGKFDVNACPEEGGLAAGTYTFQTKHEMNDVSGAANARSGGSRAVDAPFNLYDGDDAHLLRIETHARHGGRCSLRCGRLDRDPDAAHRDDPRRSRRHPVAAAA